MSDGCLPAPAQRAAPVRRREMLVAGLALPWAIAVRAAEPTVPPEVAARMPQARLQGNGRLTFFGLHVYDARLWTTPGFDASRFGEHALALELEYARALDGKAIAERSIQEMRRQADIPEAQADRWLARMSAIFTDVKAGDRITGIQRPREAAAFFLNGRATGDIRDAEFTPLFFGIWLSPKTSEPALRKALIGGAAGAT